MLAAGNRPKVVLTGFGPFGDHATNDSWDSVCKVAQGERGNELEERLGVQFVVKELPVCYEVIDDAVPQLWSEHCPLFILHVGIHPLDVFKLEIQSKRANYDKADVNGKIPDQCVCTVGQEETMQSRLDTHRLLEDVKTELADKKIDVQVQLSDDPGRYLCAYTYYMSLCKDAGRTFFLHIPPPTSSIPISLKASVIEAVVTSCLQQVKLPENSASNITRA